MLLSRLRPNAASFLRALSCSGAAGGRMPVWVLRMIKGAALKLRPVAEVEGRAADLAWRTTLPIQWFEGRMRL